MPPTPTPAVARPTLRHAQQSTPTGNCVPAKTEKGGEPRPDPGPHTTGAMSNVKTCPRISPHS